MLKPLRATGKYGGTWHRSFTAAADHEHGSRMMACDKLIFVDYTGISQDRPIAGEGVGDPGRRQAPLRIMLRKGTSGRTASRSPPT